MFIRTLQPFKTPTTLAGHFNRLSVRILPFVTEAHNTFGTFNLLVAIILLKVLLRLHDAFGLLQLKRDLVINDLPECFLLMPIKVHHCLSVLDILLSE